ncbi:MAG: hypothetical protein JSU96_19995 [Acidobacteriota bacterium]|nr:MAG: hypothetical protein JSU96_19995 [Acidobacteriota bacterium]
MTNRRDFFKTGAAAVAGAALSRTSTRAEVPVHRWDNYDFGPGPTVRNRLNQGPFGIDQDQGWRNIANTTPAVEPIRNFGTGLVGYTWEEGGPSQAARRGEETLEQHVEKLATLPFVDILYIRCDWRDIQSRPGRLDLHPIWKLTLDAAKTYGLRIGFRIQLSSPNIQPEKLSLPDFLHERVPIVTIGKGSRGDTEYREPRYDHPEFHKAFRELNELLAAEFDSHPLFEYMDLMMYGFWGEGHTGDIPNPFPDYLTAERTMVEMAEFQIETWKHLPLAVNTQPDISKTGNREVLDRCVRAGCWLRSDSIDLIEESIQVERLANRPPWLAVVSEQGNDRHYDISRLPLDEGGVNRMEWALMHVLDLGANYWSLWTEADNLRHYNERYPEGFTALQQRMGYKVRPSWIWQRKRYATSEVIVAFANHGVSGVPGILRAFAESEDGRISIGGGLDAGHPYGGRIRQASFILPQGMEGQRIRIRGEIETKGIIRPIRWACRQPLNSDGSLTVQLRRFDEPGWRKGI